MKSRCFLGMIATCAIATFAHALVPTSVFAAQPDDAAKPKRGLLGLPVGVDVFRDIEYASVDGKTLLLDIYVPIDAAAKDASEKKDEKPASSAPTNVDANAVAGSAKEAVVTPRPVIIWIHGGGWEAGTKNGCPAAQLVPHGYAAVSISYRFSQVAAYPAQIHDCKGAVRWVRANAKKYNFDPDRIGVWGASAGGHLVALLGTSAGDKELEGDVGGNLDQSSRVQAVCDWFGPTDLVKLCRMAGGETAAQASEPREGYTWPVPEAKPSETKDASTPAAASGDKARDEKATRVPTPRPILKLLGGKLEDKLEVAAKANPITFVDKSDAPFLIVHGDADSLVPLDQSEILLTSLKKSGVESKLHVVKGGGHGFWNAELLTLVREFFDRELKRDAAKASPASAK